LLAQKAVQQYGARARFAVQDFGASPLAERFGIDKYPAVFVDDALIARPEDFYVWGGPETGKYVPWSEPENRREFQRDVERMIDIRLAGGTLRSAPGGSTAAEQLLPGIAMTDLNGGRFERSQLRGKPVLIEFWATWCPPCLSTLDWMKELDPARVQVVAIAVESKREDVETLVRRHQLPGRIVMATPEVLAAFGGVPAVPTLVIADGNGKILRTFYGAPPDLHREIEKVIGAAGGR
jgi:cytochrome c biogenesis protein CcmG/thiol:disulfide interchange protein DsbE